MTPKSIKETTPGKQMSTIEKENNYSQVSDEKIGGIQIPKTMNRTNSKSKLPPMPGKRQP